MARGLIHLPLEALYISLLAMPGKGLKWIVKWFKGDRCHHFWSNRPGTVIETEPGTHMWIHFDDGEIEHRLKTAFVEGTGPGSIYEE